MQWKIKGLVWRIFWIFPIFGISPRDIRVPAHQISVFSFGYGQSLCFSVANLMECTGWKIMFRCPKQGLQIIDLFTEQRLNKIDIIL